MKFNNAPTEILRFGFFIAIIGVSQILGSQLSYAQHSQDNENTWQRPLPERTVTKLQRYEEEQRLNPPPQEAVLFIGSATPSVWDLDRWFPEFTTVKRAFGGSMINENTELAPRAIFPHKPSTIVIYAGENDVHRGKSPELTLQHFKEFITTVSKPLPNTQIVYVTMKPSILWWQDVKEMKIANELIRDYIATQDNIYYVDTFKLMIDQEGNPRRDYLGDDDLHLSDLGYDVWTAALSPVIKAAENNYRLKKALNSAN